MEQKKSISFGFRGTMLIIYQFIAYITFQVFTQYPLNILADMYGGAQTVSKLYSICAIVGILVQLALVGTISKMRNVKAFGSILGAITLVLAFMVMTLPPGTGWMVCYALVNIFAVLYATFSLGILVGQWFPTRKGTVMGIATLAFPIANGLLGPFASAVFAKGFPDVKGAFLPFFILSIVGWVIGIIFIKDYPEQVGAYRDNDRNMTPEVAKAIMLEEMENKKTSVWTYLHTFKNKEFWFGTITVAMLLGCSIGVMSQSNAIINAYAEELAFVGGYTGVMAMVMIFGCIGSFVLGLIDTKIGTKKAMIISACIMIIAGLLGLTQSAKGLLVAMIFVALYMGAASNFGVSFAAQYWRREDYSRIFTLSSPIGSAISSASPMVVAALLFGPTGYKGHAGVFTAVLIAGIVSLVCMLLTNPKHIKAQDDKYREAAGKPLDDALVGRK